MKTKQKEKFSLFIGKLKELEYVEQESIKCKSWLYNKSITVTFVMNCKSSFVHYSKIRIDTEIEVETSILYVDTNFDSIKIAFACEIGS